MAGDRLSLDVFAVLSNHNNTCQFRNRLFMLEYFKPSDPCY